MSIQRKPLQRSRRTLERVLTDDKTHSRRMSVPAFKRSTTEPDLNQIKREVNETSLSSIPLNRVVMTKRYSQREVDLRATSQQSETKLKKKLAVEQELRGAIAALKRPNPRAALKEFVESSEKRQLNKYPRSCPPPYATQRTRELTYAEFKKPIQNHSVRDIQIQATPRKSDQRQPTTSPSLSFYRHAEPHDLDELDDVPPSSLSRIPPSNHCKFRPGLQRSSSVAQTPTRGPAKFKDGVDSSSRPIIDEGGWHGKSQSDMISSLPLPTSLQGAAFATMIQQTPLKEPPGTHTDDEPREIDIGPQRREIDTPCKKPVAVISEEPSSSFSKPKESDDLYTALGWDYELAG